MENLFLKYIKILNIEQTDATSYNPAEYEFSELQANVTTIIGRRVKGYIDCRYAKLL
jgi:hypothetical protein